MKAIIKESLLSYLSITALAAVLVLCIFVALVSGNAFSARAGALKAETIITTLAPAFLSALFNKYAVEIFAVSLHKYNRQLLDSALSKLDQQIKKSTSIVRKINTTTDRERRTNDGSASPDLELIKSSNTPRTTLEQGFGHFGNLCTLYR
ncbi:hypothetical protein [Alteromonas lipotrueae]|uniref:hypothetical protein n=1 Tax=Alteromonas lipotrueae TaxID=2803814 RepID=UPI001C4733F5|nr:hypothetical protein [Alteromonas lipotrueae]